jgi:hypothetical protein
VGGGGGEWTGKELRRERSRVVRVVYVVLHLLFEEHKVFKSRKLEGLGEKILKKIASPIAQV